MRYSGGVNGFGGGFTPGVKQLIILNGIIFMLQMAFGMNQNLIEWFALHYDSVVSGMVWQVATYMFLHGGVLHILFNMLFLFFFGAELEREWGTRRFINYYLFTGVGAGLFIFAVDFCATVFAGEATRPTLGASGAILGILVAYALYFPNRQITLLLFFVIPVTLKAKYFAIGYAVIEVVSFVMGYQKGISHAGHIGGMLSAIVFFLLHRKQAMYFLPNQSINRMLGSVRRFFGLSSIKRGAAGEGSNSKFGPRTRTPRYEHGLDETRMTDKEIERTIDDLLEVISRRGIQGLNLEEQLFLDRVSRLYRHKFPD